MPKHVCVAGPSSTLNAGETKYCAPFDVTSTMVTTEAQKAVYLRTAGGTFSYLCAYLSANTISVNGTITFRINGAAGNQSVSITASTGGRFQDVTHTDNASIGDYITYQWSAGAGSGTATLVSISCVFESSTNFKVFSTSAVSYNLADTSRVYKGITSNSNGGTESDIQVKFRQSGTLQKAQLYVTTNTSVSTTTVKLRKNGADGNIAISVTALTGGLYTDLSSTDSIAVSDLVCWAASGYSAASSVVATFHSVEFLSDDSKKQQLLSGSNNSIADGVTTYNTPSACGNGFDATEADRKIPIDFNYSVEKLEVHVITNATTSASTFDLRVNGSSSALSVSITAGTGGFFSDLSNTVTGNAGDLLNVRIVNGGGGALLIRNYGMIMSPANTDYTLTLTDSITMAEAFPKSTGRTLSDAITCTDSILKTASKLLTDAITATETINRASTRELLDVMSLTELVTKSLQIEFEDALELTENFAPQLIFVKILLDGLTLTDSIVKDVAHILTDNVALTEYFNRATIRILTDALTLTDSKTAQAEKVMSDAIALTDVMTRLSGKVLTDNVALTEAFIRAAGKVLTDTTTLSETVIKAWERTLSDSFDLQEFLSFARLKTLTDVITLSEHIRFHVLADFDKVRWLSQTIARAGFTDESLTKPMLDNENCITTGGNG